MSENAPYHHINPPFNVIRVSLEPLLLADFLDDMQDGSGGRDFDRHAMPVGTQHVHARRHHPGAQGEVGKFTVFLFIAIWFLIISFISQYCQIQVRRKSENHNIRTNVLRNKQVDGYHHKYFYQHFRESGANTATVAVSTFPFISTFQEAELHT